MPARTPSTVPEPVRQATFPVRVETSKLADGVYLLGGGTHNSIAVEFRDFIAVFEAPLDEERSLAVIEEIVRLIPEQADPVRWSTRTSTSITSAGCAPTCTSARPSSRTWKNFDFYARDVLNYAPRTLKPDMVSLWPPTELAEGYYYETDQGELRHQRRHAEHEHPLRQSAAARRRHADGVSAQREAADRGGSRRHGSSRCRRRRRADQRSFFNAVRKLGLNASQVVPVHGRPAPWPTAQ